MLLPSIFTENLLDDFFDHPHHSNHFRSYASEMLRTDIKDLGNVYEMTMNLPGVKKENVKAELKDGYLTISAASISHKDEKDSDGVYIRRERYAGACSRSFYVGENIKQEDIKARFEDGTLKLQVPKNSKEVVVENPNYITIEG